MSRVHTRRIFLLTAVLFVGFFVFTPTKAFAATFTAAASGNWNVGTTWGGACASSCVAGTDYPGAADTVTIASSRTVTLTQAEAATTLSVNSTGTLALGSNTLTVSGTATIASGSSVTSNGGTLKGAILLINGGSFGGAGAITLEKTGSGSNNSTGGSTFSNDVTFRNSSTGSFFISVTSTNTFNGNILFEQSAAGTITIGASTLATGKTVGVGGGGFTTGTLSFAGLTQNGSTAQTITLTGTAILSFGGTWNGNVTGTAPQMSLSGATFNGTATLEKNGATNNTSVGNSTFSSDATIRNTGSGAWTLGFTTSNTFNGNLHFEGTGNIATDKATLASGMTVDIGPGGYTAGTLTLNNFTQTGSTAQTLTLTSAATLTFSTGSTWNGAMTATAPVLLLSGGTFNGVSTFIKTGTGTNTSNGGCVYNNDITIRNNSATLFRLYQSSNDAFNGNIIVESTSGSIVFGNTTSGTGTLASGKTVTVGPNGFVSGTLQFMNFTQTGSTAQTLTLTGSATLAFSTGSTWNGDMTATAPVLLLNGGTFNGVSTFIKTGTGTNTSIGGGTYNNDVTFRNSTATIFLVNNQAADAFNGNIFLESSGSGGFRFGNFQGSAVLASGKTISVGPNGFSAGLLAIANFTQNGSTAQTLTLTGTAQLTLATGNIWNGNLTVTTPLLSLSAVTFNGSATFTMNGSSNSVSTNDVFNGDVSFTTTSTGGITIGNVTGDTFGGNVTVNQTSTGSIFFGSGSAVQTFNKSSGTQTFNTGGKTISKLTHSGAGTLQLVTNDLTVSSALTNSAGTIDLNGKNLTATSATFSNTGTIQLIGSETITGLTQDVAKGTWQYVGGGSTSYTIKDFGSTDYFNLIIAGGSGDTFSSGAAKVLAGSLTITSGTFDDNGQTLTVNGNWSNSGTFTASSGAVTLSGSAKQTLSGTLTGSSAFYDLTITNSSGTSASDDERTGFVPGVAFSSAATVTHSFTATTANTRIEFNSGSTYTFNNINWNGQATNSRIYFRNSATSGTWNLNVSGTQTATLNMDVSRSNASFGSQIVVNDGSSHNGGNNTNWLFATLPGAPTSLTPTPGDTLVALSWTAPVSSGGGTISDYVIEYKLTSDSSWSIFADGVSTGTSGSVTGLINNLSYDFRVSTVNEAGQGSASSVVSSTPTRPVSVPDAPAIGTATGGNVQASVTFTPLYTPWYNSSWGYRTKITIDHTKVQSTDQAYFPVLISTTSVAFKSTGSGGHVGQTDGGDIVFTSSDGTTKLAHEIETYTSSTGQLIAWVKVPSVSASVDTDIYIYYGNASVADQWNVTGTWDDGGSNYFKGVWHLPNGSSLTANDSTSNANNGTLTGSPTATTGQVDGGASFNGTSQYVQKSSPTGTSASSGTMSAWVNVAALPVGSGNAGVVSGVFENSTDNDQVYFGAYNNSGALSFNIVNRTGATTNYSAYTSTTYSLSTPYFITYIGGTGGGKFYVNGVLQSLTTLAGSVANTSWTSSITNSFLMSGARQFNSTPTFYYSGSIDETRISSTARSADWIKTEYNNQNSPSTFYSSASEESFTTSSSNGGSPITGYTVTSSPGGFTGTGSGSPIVVTGLTNGTAYTFSVTATNSIGTGSASSPSNSVTPATTPDAPTGVSATPGNTQMGLSWSAPIFGGGTAITDYVVEYKLHSDTGWTVFSDGVSTATSTTVTGLTNGSAYDFRVSAANSVGQGTASSIVTSTPITVPGAPTSPVATRGNTQASVSFTAPASDGGSTITSYTVTSNPGSHTGTGSASPIVVTGLTNGTAYTFSVTATNAAGQGSASVDSNSVTPATTPDAPIIGTATAGNAQASVTFTVPSSNGGSAITSYTVTSSTGGHTGTGSGSPIVVTGLTNGTAYTFTVTATNDVGTGPASSDSNSVTPITIPSAPIIGTATRGNTQASITFTPPVSDGGSAITAYTVTSSPGSFTGSGSASPIVVTGLTNGSAYTFSVTATNAAGTGSASSDSNSVTPATVPDTPTSLSPTAGNAQVSLSWTAPVDTGGSVVTDYVIEYKLTSDSSWTIFSDSVSAVTTGTVTGLTNGSSYDFRVSAANDIGQGSVSASATSIPVTVPDAPIIGTATRGNAQASVTFSAPVSDGGTAITSYTVTSSPGNHTGTGSTSPIVVTGLTNGTAYTFTVTATNAVGEGTSSGASNSVTPATVPDAPTSPSATAGNTQATISFTPPVSDGGSAITAYTVTSSPGGYTGTGSSSPVTVTGLTNGTTYTFTVTATNAIGEGVSSVDSNSVRLSTEPGVPVNLAASVGGSSIGLSWSAPASDGGSAITDYSIEYQLTTGGSWSTFADGVSGTTTATVTGLSNGTSYDFRVSAVNIIGQGSPSDTVSATPGEPAQVLIQNFSDVTSPSIGTAVRITNEGSIAFEYQYSWCVTDSNSNLCGGGDDVFDSSAAKLIQHGENFDTTLNSTVEIPGNYWFHVNVTFGSQTSSASQSFTAVATYPDVPIIGIATPGNTQATVSFTPPVSDGGSTITLYRATSNPGGITATSTASPVIVTGLTNGTSYNFTVTATNGVGEGNASGVSNSVIPATVPGAPTGLSASAGNAQVVLSWTPPVDNGGSAITDYVIEYKLSSDSSWSTFADGVSVVTSVTITGLTNDVSYDFRVSAVNAVGQGSINATSATSSAPPSSGSGSSGPGPGGTYGQPTQIYTQTPTTTPKSDVATPTKSHTTSTTKSPRTQKPSVERRPVTPPIQKPNTVPVSATPTEHPTASSTSGAGSGIPWVLLSVIVGDFALGAGLTFFLMRRRPRYNDYQG